MVDVAQSQMQNPGSSGSSGGLTPTQQAEAWRGQWGYRIRLGDPDLSDMIELETVGPNSVVNGSIIPPDIATQWDIGAMNVMGSSGGDTGTPIGQDLYYVYWANTGPFSPGLGFSLAAPTLIAGQWLLGNAADPTQFLFLGWIQTDATPRVADTVKERHIVNYWNRRLTPLAVTPNYVNNNAATTYFRTTANWAPMTATAATSQVSFIGNGEDAVWLEGSWTCLQDVAQPIFGGIGRSTTTPVQVAVMPADAVAQVFVSCACAYSYVPALAGTLETISLLCQTGGAAAVFVADFARTGSASDPPATSLRGFIRA